IPSAPAPPPQPSPPQSPPQFVPRAPHHPILPTSLPASSAPPRHSPIAAQYPVPKTHHASHQAAAPLAAASIGDAKTTVPRRAPTLHPPPPAASTPTETALHSTACLLPRS